MKRTATGIALAIIASIFTHIVLAENNSDLSNIESVGIVRYLNTIEQMYKYKEKRFGSLEEINSWEGLREAQESIRKMSNDASMKNPDLGGKEMGNKLALAVTSDGQHYLLSLKTSPDNNKSLFSDDTGLIYEGTPLK